jgi:Domain of unknown function (DUF4424)
MYKPEATVGGIRVLSVMLAATIALSGALLVQPVWANDTAAALGAGGITFEQSADVEMQSENLYLSEKEVRVDYQFKNTGADDVTTVVAFPFPKIPNGDIPVPEMTGPFPENYVSFTVMVDGQPVKTDVAYKAILDETGEDISARLKKAGLPLDPQVYWNLSLKDVPESTIEALKSEGLLEGGDYLPQWRMADYYDAEPDLEHPSDKAILFESKQDISAVLDEVGLPRFSSAITDEMILALPEATRKMLLDKKILSRQFYPRWQFQAVRYWTQTFPKDTVVQVQHRYKPIVGSTAGSPLDVACSDTFADMDESRQPEFCVDESLMKALAPSRSAKTRCEWPRPNWDPQRGPTVGYLDYILTTGANWKGPIQDFTLTIDKGTAKNLVSLCWKGDLKKISPTQFQYSAKNFTPEQDLKLLLIKR